MPSVKTLTIFTTLALCVGYFSYVWYPEACDFPIGMKAFYSLIRFVSHVSNFVHSVGGNYLTFYRLTEFDFSPSLEGVVVTTDVFGEVPTTIFKPTDFANGGQGSAIIYYHGGGWALGGVEIYAAFLKVLAKQSGMMIIFPEYRLAPENPYPIPLLDCASATMDFVKRAEEFGVNPKKIIFAGDSAGGNLATAVILHLQKREKRIKPCMLSVTYPVLQMSNFMLPSYQQNSNPPLLNPPMVVHFFLLYMGMQNETRLIKPMLRNLHMEGLKSETFAEKIDEALVPKKNKQRPSEMIPYEPSAEDHVVIKNFKKTLQKHATDPEFAPLSATDEELKLLPRTFILTCEYDVLRDDGIILHERMKSLGMDATLENLEFGAHGVLNLYGAFAYDKLDRAVSKMIKNMEEGLSKC